MDVTYNVGERFPQLPCALHFPRRCTCFSHPSIEHKFFSLGMCTQGIITQRATVLCSCLKHTAPCKQLPCAVDFPPCCTCISQPTTEPAFACLCVPQGTGCQGRHEPSLTLIQPFTTHVSFMNKNYLPNTNPNTLERPDGGGSLDAWAVQGKLCVEKTR